MLLDVHGSKAYTIETYADERWCNCDSRENDKEKRQHESVASAVSGQMSIR